MTAKEKRVIAIHLPQFHPFKENDEWWGMGFTEWTNVTKAKPRYEGHYQPHLPTDTGFYDLRLPESRKLQADLAKQYGIYGFCYYHYWFNGKQLMERPVNEILSSGEPEFPFMLCWANENWARNWDGGFTDVLIKQDYSIQDDMDHMRWLCKNVFSDRRYIRVSGKPVFAVYRTSLFPNVKETLSVWRRIAAEEFGTELYLIETKFPGDIENRNSITEGFDAAMDFQPIGVMVSKILREKVKLLNPKDNSDFPEVYNYSDYVDYCKASELPDRCFPCVSPGFDNSPRRVGKTFLSFTETSPNKYGDWLMNELCRGTSFQDDEENFVFINAWNEWAEGNHIEPDIRWGRKYLEKTKETIDLYNKKGVPVDYDKQRKKAYEIYLKKHKGEIHEREMLQEYNLCKDVIKAKDNSYYVAKQFIKSRRKHMLLKYNIKLMYKLVYYKKVKTLFDKSYNT